jgi:hypothetical protein
VPARRVAVMVLTAILGSGLLAGPLSVLLPARSASAFAGSERVVLVGIPGLQWDDLSATGTPALWQLAETGAAASLSVRAVRPRTCPIDGWLTVNAAARAMAERPGAGGGTACPAVPQPAGSPGSWTVPGFGAITAYNRQFGYAPRFGFLAENLAGAPALAVGPGAAVALADAQGHLAAYQGSPGEVDGPTLARYRLTVVDLGAVPEGTGRAEAVRTADVQLTRIAAAARGSGTRLIVAGLADSGWTPHLHVMAAASPGGAEREGRWLTASSTRVDGLVQLTDMTPTVVAELGLAPRAAAPVGAVMETTGGRTQDTASAVRKLAEQDTAAQLIRDTVGRFFALFALALVVAVIAAFVAHRRGRAAARAAVLFVASVPVATFLANLVPWWSTDVPVLLLAAAVVGWAALVTALASLGPLRRHLLGPPGVVAAVTVLVLAADVVAGSPLQASSLLGLSPLVAGRFYGFGNVAFAVFAMAAVFAATWIAAELAERGERGQAALAVAGVGVVAVVADGWPAFGADFGGVRLAAIGAAAVITVGVIAVLDWLGPAEQRSHLGRFVQQVLDGDAAEVIGRKAETNLHSFANPIALLVPLVFVLLAWLVLQPERFRAGPLLRSYQAVPVLRTGLIALLVTAVLGFAVNDSGVMVPAVALTMAVPLAAAAVAGQTLDRRAVPAAPAGPGPRPEQPSHAGSG